MKLTTIKNIDKQNRLVLPRKYVELLGIDENTDLFIEIETEKKEITIKLVRLV